MAKYFPFSLTASIKRFSLHTPCDHRIKKSLPRRRRGFSKNSAHGKSGKSFSSRAIFSFDTLKTFSNGRICLFILSYLLRLRVADRLGLLGEKRGEQLGDGLAGE